jgi:putative ABC transport system substrate-binding protein
MKRRALLALAAALLAGAPPLHAQRTRRIYRVGVLIAGPRDSPEARRILREFLESMRELGYEEGRDFAMAVRYYGGDRSTIAELAAGLIAKRPDVLLADVSSTAAVLKAQTATIPIVMAAAIDPAHEALDAKLVELVSLLLPDAKRIAFLVDPGGGPASSPPAAAEAAAKAHRLQLLALPLRAAPDVESLADRLSRVQADALIVPADAALLGLCGRIVDAALEAGVPTISVLAECAEHGALAAYGTDAAAGVHGAARSVERILKGAIRTGELAVEQPKQFELVLNLKTARAMRIDIARSLLLRADRVIE